APACSSSASTPPASTPKPAPLPPRPERGATPDPVLRRPAAQQELPRRSLRRTQVRPVEARAAARFALTERPGRDTPLSPELRTLPQAAGRLQAVVRQRPRLINQLHDLLALAFPELALLVKDLAGGWVLELVHRYPTAARLAEASAGDL